MYTVYILKSINKGQYYIGQTNNLIRRLNDHQRGKDHYSRCGKPWVLVYSEEYKTRREAMAREKKLKSLKKRKGIENIINAAG